MKTLEEWGIAVAATLGHERARAVADALGAARGGRTDFIDGLLFAAAQMEASADGRAARDSDTLLCEAVATPAGDPVKVTDGVGGREVGTALVKDGRIRATITDPEVARRLLYNHGAISMGYRVVEPMAARAAMSAQDAPAPTSGAGLRAIRAAALLLHEDAKRWLAESDDRANLRAAECRIGKLAVALDRLLAAYGVGPDDGPPLDEVKAAQSIPERPPWPR